MVDITRVLAVPESDLRNDGLTWAIKHVQEALKGASEHRKPVVERALLRDQRVRGAINRELALLEKRRSMFVQVGMPEIESLTAEVKWRKERILGEEAPKIDKKRKEIATAKRRRDLPGLQTAAERAKTELTTLDVCLALFEEIVDGYQKRHERKMPEKEAAQTAFWDAVKDVRDRVGSSDQELASQMKYLDEKVITPFEKAYGKRTLDEDKRKEDFMNFVFELIRQREEANAYAEKMLAFESGYVGTLEHELQALEADLAKKLRRQDERIEPFVKGIWSTIDADADVARLAKNVAEQHRKLGIQVKTIGETQIRTQLIGAATLRPSIGSELRTVEPDVAFR